jgi:hypothetical protein
MRNLKNASAVAAIMLVAGGLTAAGPAGAAGTDCRVQPPADAGTAHGDAPKDTSDHLSDKLATCGSVINPPPVGDREIVEPAPSVGDPINLHPTAPDTRRP